MRTPVRLDCGFVVSIGAAFLNACRRSLNTHKPDMIVSLASYNQETISSMWPKGLISLKTFQKIPNNGVFFLPSVPSARIESRSGWVRSCSSNTLLHCWGVVIEGAVSEVPLQQRVRYKAHAGRAYEGAEGLKGSRGLCFWPSPWPLDCFGRELGAGGWGRRRIGMAVKAAARRTWANTIDAEQEVPDTATLSRAAAMW